MQRFPEGRRYIELGFCMTSMPGGDIIAEKTPSAIREPQACACQNGGNAVLLAGDAESGFHSGFGYSQQRVKARGTVLYFFPADTR